MGNFQAKMFNKKASDPKNKPNKILEAVALKSGQSIADIGAGGGYFSLKFAEAVGSEGKVYAVDTNQQFLDFIRKSAEENKLNNIITIIATEDRLDLPEHSLDFIFMRNITHHISNRAKYFGNLKKFIKPGGKIIIIEYKSDKSLSFRGMFGHHVAKEIIIKEMEEAGYLLEKDFSFLPEQHFTIYST